MRGFKDPGEAVKKGVKSTISDLCLAKFVHFAGVDEEKKKAKSLSGSGCFDLISSVRQVETLMDVDGVENTRLL